MIIKSKMAQTDDEVAPDAPADGAPDDAAPTDDSSDDGSHIPNMPGQIDATPEEEEAVARAMTLAKRAMAAKGWMDRLLSLAKSKGVPEAVAENTVMLVEVVDKKLDLPEDTIIAFATQVAMLCIHICSQARIFKESEDAINDVMGALMKQLAQAYSLDPEEAAQILQEMENGTGPASAAAPAPDQESAMPAAA